MCHEIPLEKRLAVDEDTVPLAELLLTKLQIIELNEKDVRDTVALLLEHDVTDDDASVNATQCRRPVLLRTGACATRSRTTWSAFASTSGDTTSTATPSRARASTRSSTAIEGAPKSRSWRLRAKVGERKRWYELPEEV